MVLVIFLSFLACYLPITIVKVADAEVKCPGKNIIYRPFDFWKRNNMLYSYLLHRTSICAHLVSAISPSKLMACVIVVSLYSELR